jgi:hypothetical protein
MLFFSYIVFYIKMFIKVIVDLSILIRETLPFTNGINCWKTI